MSPTSSFAPTRLARPFLALAGALTLAVPALASDVVVKAGTIYAIDGAGPIQNGAVFIRDGLIVSVGAATDMPSGVEVVDYGETAVIIPGLVAADSGYAEGRGSARTVEPGLVALDGFDFYGEYALALSSGVTSAYITPARRRLIAGQGAVVKLGGDDPGRRVLAAPAAVHGSIGSEARNTPGFWEPPIPPTSDIGLGYAKPQLPRSTMGAIVALEELLAAVRSGEDTDEHGPYAVADLKRLVDAGRPWRMGADREAEIRALIRFAAKHGISLVVDGGAEASGVAAELAAAGVPVIFRVPFYPNSPATNWGKSGDAWWPTFDVPARLADAGVRVAISHSGSMRDLLFAARLASRGGLDPETALRAITLTPAELLGAADRVGSLAPGKDADFVVLGGDPMQGGAPIATWLDGAVAWRSRTEGSSTVVVEVEELYVGDGEVLRPGALLIEDGRIVEVGRRVARPGGAQLVRGFAAMPGMIDAFGHLGLSGTRNTPSTDFPLARIVGPGDGTDRRVALAGITTVILSPRGDSRSGVPMTAYKPAASEFDRQIVADPATLRVTWTDRNRLKSGENVRGLLEKAREYGQKWDEYRTKLAEWEATPRTAEVAKKDDTAGDKKDDGKGADDEAKKDDEDDGDKKKKKKKKDEDDEPEADPVGGIWEGTLQRPPLSGEFSIRIQLVNTDGAIDGSIRCAALSEGLIEVEGHFDGKELSVAGLGTQGWVELTGKAKQGELEATIKVGETEIALEAKRTRPDVPRASRPLPAKTVTEDDTPKGKPREPKLDAKLEPFWRAMKGEGTIVVAVDREDEILACVDAFAKVGIRPILYGAEDLHWVADEVAGRVAGALLDHQVVKHNWKKGLEFRNRYAEIANAGIPVAFHSLAEEGAAELPTRAAYAAAAGLSFEGALRAMTSDVADMFGIAGRVGRLKRGLDADVLVLDGPPLDPGTSVRRVWVAGEEVVR